MNNPWAIEQRYPRIPRSRSLYRPQCYWRYRIRLQQLIAHRVSTVSAGAQYGTQHWTEPDWDWIESYTVSLFNMPLYCTSKIWMQCLTDLIVLRLAVESIFRNEQFAVLCRYLRHSFESDSPPLQFLLPCCIQNRWTPNWLRIWSLLETNVSELVNWATLHYILFSKLGVRQRIYTGSGPLLRIIFRLRVTAARDLGPGNGHCILSAGDET